MKVEKIKMKKLNEQLFKLQMCFDITRSNLHYE